MYVTWFDFCYFCISRYLAWNVDCYLWGTTLLTIYNMKQLYNDSFIKLIATFIYFYSQEAAIVGDVSYHEYQ